MPTSKETERLAEGEVDISGKPEITKGKCKGSVAKRIWKEYTGIPTPEVMGRDRYIVTVAKRIWRG